MSNSSRERVLKVRPNAKARIEPRNGDVHIFEGSTMLHRVIGIGETDSEAWDNADSNLSSPAGASPITNSRGGSISNSVSEQHAWPEPAAGETPKHEHKFACPDRQQCDPECYMQHKCACGVMRVETLGLAPTGGSAKEPMCQSRSSAGYQCIQSVAGHRKYHSTVATPIEDSAGGVFWHDDAKPAEPSAPAGETPKPADWRLEDDMDDPASMEGSYRSDFKVPEPVPAGGAAEYVRRPQPPVKAVRWTGDNLADVRTVYPGLGEEYMRDKGCVVGDYVVCPQPGQVRFWNAEDFEHTYQPSAPGAEQVLVTITHETAGFGPIVRAELEEEARAEAAAAIWDGVETPEQFSQREYAERISAAAPVAPDAVSAAEKKRCIPCNDTGLWHCSDPMHCGGPWSNPLATELLPCPFCGSNDLKVITLFSEDAPHREYARAVMCNVCHAHGRSSYPIGWTESEQAAREAWNDRSLPSQTASAKRDPSGNSRDLRQSRVGEWAIAAFTAAEAMSLPQRGLRLFEEAGEAAQATGLDRERAHLAVDYVWGRPVGNLFQELGGVGVTTLALAHAAGLSAEHAEIAEVQRVLSRPLAHFQKRNAEKNAAGLLATPQGVTEPHE